MSTPHTVYPCLPYGSNIWHPQACNVTNTINVRTNHAMVHIKYNTHTSMPKCIYCIKHPSISYGTPRWATGTHHVAYLDTTEHLPCGTPRNYRKQILYGTSKYTTNHKPNRPPWLYIGHMALLGMPLNTYAMAHVCIKQHAIWHTWAWQRTHITCNTLMPKDTHLMAAESGIHTVHTQWHTKIV